MSALYPGNYPSSRLILRRDSRLDWASQNRKGEARRGGPAPYSLPYRGAHTMRSAKFQDICLLGSETSATSNRHEGVGAAWVCGDVSQSMQSRRQAGLGCSKAARFKANLSLHPRCRNAAAPRGETATWRWPRFRCDLATCLSEKRRRAMMTVIYPGSSVDAHLSMACQISS